MTSFPRETPAGELLARWDATQRTGLTAYLDSLDVMLALDDLPAIRSQGGAVEYLAGARKVSKGDLSRRRTTAVYLVNRAGRQAVEGSGITDPRVLYYAARLVRDGETPTRALARVANLNRDEAAREASGGEEFRSLGKYPATVADTWEQGLSRAERDVSLTPTQLVERLAQVLLYLPAQDLHALLDAAEGGCLPYTTVSAPRSADAAFDIDEEVLA
ncbi:MAG TPA: hypothetical protein VHN99_11905 [Deinococcales bacterium]|nr:hypothetical protein [Deinococcales bacterium]